MLKKPITIAPVSGGYTVEVDGEFVGRKRKKMPSGRVVRMKNGKLGFSDQDDGEVVIFSKEDAKSIAHTIGHYKLNLGDFTYSYTNAPKGFWDD